MNEDLKRRESMTTVRPNPHDCPKRTKAVEEILARVARSEARDAAAKHHCPVCYDEFWINGVEPVCPEDKVRLKPGWVNA